MNERLCPTCQAAIPPGKAACPACLLRLAWSQLRPETLPFSTPVPVDADPLSPGSWIGRYRLIRTLGEGGMGVVYLAEQREPLRREVALKVIRLGLDTRQVMLRFEAERQTLARMDHPGIARVLDAGTTPAGRPYFVMERVDGLPITQYCDLHQLDTAARIGLLQQVCAAIQHAHQKGIVHRDLKPSNLLVSEQDGQPVVKVIDFGIAKSIQGPLTDQTLVTEQPWVLGTPTYMSPEQAGWQNQDIDTRSDLYSLGVLLYELLTGCTPFELRELARAGQAEILRFIREEEPQRPSTRLESLSPEEQTTRARQRQIDPRQLHLLLRRDLDWIIMKSLEKDRSRRYGSALSLAEDLRRYLADEPVSAREPSRSYQFRKFVHRHRTALAMTTSLAGVVLGGGLLSGWLALQATRARRQTSQLNDQLRHQVTVTDSTQQRLQLQQIEDLFGQNQGAQAVARLGHLLLAHPTNRVAAERLVSALVHRRFPQPLTPPLVHGSWVESVHFRADGRQLVTAGGDGIVQVWDAQTGEPAGPAIRYPNGVEMAEFSPDGRLLLVQSQLSIRLWDATTRQPLTEPIPSDSPRGFRRQAWAVPSRFSPDGTRFLSLRGTQVRVHDVPLGTVSLPLIETGKDVRSAEFSPNGRQLLVVTAGGGLRFWEVATGQPQGPELQHGSEVLMAGFSPDGQSVVSTSGDGSVRVWSVDPPAPRFEAQRRSPAGGSGAASDFRPDSQSLAVTSGPELQFWDAQAGRLRSESLRSDPGFWGVTWTPDATRVLTGTGLTELQLWDAQSGRRCSETFRVDDYPRRVAFRPDGQILATAAGSSVWLWDVQSSPSQGRRLPLAGKVTRATYSPDGRLLLTVSGTTVTLWNLATGQPARPAWIHPEPIIQASFSRDGKTVVAMASSSVPYQWDVSTGRARGTPPAAASAKLSPWLTPERQVSADGSRCVVVTQDGLVRLWNLKDSQPIGQALPMIGGLGFARFSPDGRSVVTSAGDQTLRIWDAETGEPKGLPWSYQEILHEIGFSPDGSQVWANVGSELWAWKWATGQKPIPLVRLERGIRSTTVSPDGRRLLTASWDHTARVWNAETGQPLSEPMRHVDAVVSAEFSPDGRRVLTASQDRTARLWDAETGAPLSEPLAHRNALANARFSPSGQNVLTVSFDGSVTEWETPEIPTPVPAWFIQRVVSQVGWQVSTNGEPERLPWSKVREAKAAQSLPDGSDFYARLARWLETQPGSRTVSPFSPVTVSEHVERLIRERTPWSLQEAFQLSLTNAPIVERLAAQLRLGTNPDPDFQAQAEFYLQWARDRAVRRSEP